MLRFPFGMPIIPVKQRGSGPKRIFVLGVYASAVHARWVDESGKTIINALAVASEPEIFWCGHNAESIIKQISLPQGAGQLVAASKSLNGPSGIALDSLFLKPLGVTRNDAWLCDLLPESRCNPKQGLAIEREYDSRSDTFGLPTYNFPPVPDVLASEDRRLAIESEIATATPEVLITLGDQPLKWFTRHYGSHTTLGAYGDTLETYGHLHDLVIGERTVSLLPLVHPRQAARLGTHSAKWSELHSHWVEHVASDLLTPSIVRR